MTLNVERVTVLAGGMEYGEWESTEIAYAINQAAREFTVNGTERPGQFRFPPGTPVAILANGTLVLDGYVNRYSPRGDMQSHTVTISGRSRSQDFVDNSAVHEPGFFENKDPAQIAAELDKFGVGVKAEVPLEKIPYWQINQGESPWRSIDRALRPMGAVMMGLADGSIAITNAMAAKGHGGGLIEGLNILQFQGEITDDKMHSDYTVKGQSRLGHGVEALEPTGETYDGRVPRYRPKIIVNEGDTDKARAQTRAENEKNRSAGMSIKAVIATQGWRDDGGKIWEANHLVFVHSPRMLKIVQPMLIESVRLTQDSQSGSIATLTLVDPRAYNGQGGGGSGGDPAWGGTQTLKPTGETYEGSTVPKYAPSG